jgi:hypothetical protein
MREAKVLAAVERAGESGGSGATAAELLAPVYDDVAPAVWPIALLSLQAHLEKLERDGRVRGEVRAGDQPRYSAVR